MPHWINEEFAKRFNSHKEYAQQPDVPLEMIRAAYDAMPSNRVGLLYDFIRYIKREYDALDPAKQHLLRRRMGALGRCSG